MRDANKIRKCDGKLRLIEYLSIKELEDNNEWDLFFEKKGGKRID